ncbi:MAG TPA: hypothetical protein VND40_03295 [Nitrososphaerales archaeon]|nr:hypothetical protein [Nitrososphaerales archaeon]
MAPKLRAERTQPHGEAATDAGHESPLARSIGAQLEGYLNGRMLLSVKIRREEGKNIEGFLKIEGGKGERLLVDFTATATAEGGLSSLEVGGSKISLAPGPAAKRTH